MGSLDLEFQTLAADLRTLLGLLDEAGEVFWRNTLNRSLAQIESNRLSGVTFVLGCYGGVDTFSDLVIGKQWQEAEPLKFQNLNARLGELRTRTFESAKVIASRRSW